jgi:hypothetical protein
LQSSANPTLCEVLVRSKFYIGSAFLFLLFLSGTAQTRQSTPPSSHDVNPPMTDEDEARARITSEMAKKAAKDRAASIKHDTDRLLKLSVELKDSVDKSDENVLSLDGIKKAEEIEKLAHSVKEKMKGPN